MTLTKRVGRGHGSGKGGHTTGRGTKGQKSRYKMPILFEGVKNKKSLLHRVPLLRGKMKNKSHGKPVVISAKDLNVFAENEVITIEALVNAGLVRELHARKRGVKIVGLLTKKLNIELPMSHALKNRINA